MNTIKKKDEILGLTYCIPLLFVLLGLLGYPIVYAFYTSMTNKVVGLTPKFIGFKNYIDMVTSDKVILGVFANTGIYVSITVAAKMLLGITMALVLNEQFLGVRFFRSWLLLPWIAPTIVTALVWRWMFNQSGGVINYLLMNLGWMEIPPAWLGEKDFARAALIITNIWRGIPFVSLTVLAGLQSIPNTLFEAADIDGASVITKITKITLPSISSVILIAFLLTFIWTFNDTVLVWTMTAGGPSNATHLPSTYAYMLGFQGSRLGYATAVSLIGLPVVVIIVVILSRKLWSD